MLSIPICTKYYGFTEEINIIGKRAYAVGFTDEMTLKKKRVTLR